MIAVLASGSEILERRWIADIRAGTRIRDHGEVIGAECSYRAGFIRSHFRAEQIRNRNRRNDQNERNHSHTDVAQNQASHRHSVACKAPCAFLDLRQREMAQDDGGDCSKRPQEKDNSAHHAGRRFSATLLRTVPGWLRCSTRWRGENHSAVRAGRHVVGKISLAIRALFQGDFSLILDCILQKNPCAAWIHSSSFLSCLSSCPCSDSGESTGSLRGPMMCELACRITPLAAK